MTTESPVRPLFDKAKGTAARMTRRLAATQLGQKAKSSLRSDPLAVSLQQWLRPLFGEELDRIDAGLEGAGPEGYDLFRELDDDLWSLLLTKEYEDWPRIRAFLPDLPEPALQQMWNGTSGPALAAQSVCFYRKLKEMQSTHGERPLDESRVLDFGCGWGRLTRMLGRDVQPGGLYGCDPVESILQISRDSRVPARLGRSEFLPETLPFEEKFDLVFAFSVFTHISEAAHFASLEAIHGGLSANGLFVVTIRPPAYIDFNPLMKPAIDRLGPDYPTKLREPRYVFVPHETDGHPQYDDADDDPMSYGETIITLPYVRDRWSDLFELIDVSVLTGDMYQVALTLRRR